jgi:CO/xanthine dehydrogenase FAD-binding subunit
MKFPPLEIRIPSSVEQALDLLADLGSDARVLAGGQSLLPLLRYRIIRPHVLVDINALSELRQLKVEDGIQIGALVRHAELERMPLGDGAAAGLLRVHAKQIAFWAVRNRGTAVGSVVHADPKGDWPLAFFALDAKIELRSKRGGRVIPVRNFVRGPLDTQREVDELAVGLRICKARFRPLRWGRRKLMHRAGEYATCSAIALEYDSGWECWVGATEHCPVRLANLASRLSEKTTPQRASLAAVAEDELAIHMPEMSRVDRHRHASNVVDAVMQALEGNTP